MLSAYAAGERLHDEIVTSLQPVITAAELAQARSTVASLVRVEPHIIKYIQEIVARTRRDDAVQIGAGPRASLALLEASRAVAALRECDLHHARRREIARRAGARASRHAEPRGGDGRTGAVRHPVAHLRTGGSAALRSRTLRPGPLLIRLDVAPGALLALLVPVVRCSIATILAAAFVLLVVAAIVEAIDAAANHNRDRATAEDRAAAR